MGQQQLLLIALGIIVVGIAVVVGITLFSTLAAESNRDQLFSDLNILSALAQAHFRKPVTMGGGGNSFANYEIPTALLENANGTLEHIKTAAPNSSPASFSPSAHDWSVRGGEIGTPMNT